MSQQNQAEPRAFTVDLDGTLVRTDLLWESLGHVLTRNPLKLFSLAALAVSGKERLKTHLAEQVPLAADTLPFNTDVLELVDEARQSNRRTVLATASPRTYAEAVAVAAGGFDEVIATDANGSNLAGASKAERLAEEYGDGGFSYVGNASPDVRVWARAGEAIVVSNSKRLRREVDQLGVAATYIETPKPTLRTWRKQMRVHQWAKNALVVLPLITAHMAFTSSAFRTMAAVAAFSLLASAVYIWNDLHDIADDRAHPTKRNRPLAAGLIPIPQALAAAGVFVVVAAVIAALLGPLFAAALTGYLIANVLYSSYLKSVVIADVVVLALLYTVRVLAGCAAIGTTPSIWLIAFSLMFFFSLGVMKRYAELVNHNKNARSYVPSDKALLLGLGLASGVGSILLVPLYINDPEVAELYARPSLLWPIVPLMLYWLSRAWMITERKQMEDDPVLFAMKDRTSIAIFGTLAAITFLAAVIK